MSHFELQPAIPTVKEIFDKFEKEFCEFLNDAEDHIYSTAYEAFLTAKIKTMELFKGVMPISPQSNR